MPLFHWARSDRPSGCGSGSMTIKFSAGDAPGADLLVVTEKHLLDAAQALARTIDKIAGGAFGEAGAAVVAVRDLKAAFQTVMEERGRVDKLRKQVAGTVGAGALDLHAARDEIGRRLACLRDAGTG